MYYLGKLRRTREFVISDNLNFDERNYWDVWFAKCSGNNTLLPFLNKKRKEKKTWLFAIRENSDIRIGLCAISEDFVGRKYPFLTYVKYQYSLEVERYLYRSLFMFFCCFRFFENSITDGFLSEGYLDNYIFNNEMKKLKQSDLFNQALEDIIANTVSSIWFEIHSEKFIKHDNVLTCYLYNKILGE